MKTRIKFTKSGPLKFVGHLDVMRFFQKAFRRAEIDVEFSRGYSPHQIISFAAPLGVGLTSEGEYVDVQLGSCDDRETMLERMNAVMPEYIRAVDFKILADDSKNAMSIVAAADYMVSIRDGYDFMEKEKFEEMFVQFMEQDTIEILKKSKKTETELDIKPFIYEYSLIPFANALSESVADKYENDTKVYLKLATGSVNNIKPELVMEAFCKFTGIEYNEFVFQVHRIDVYANLGTENDRNLVPLNKIN
jgi:radical SAM-linked protein